MLQSAAVRFGRKLALKYGIMYFACGSEAHDVQETDADMAKSVFCVCPPGATQDTTRMFRAILKGCIPVTFFRANDLPFARFLGVPYGEFMLNIQPDDYPQLNDRIGRILASPQRLRHMQVTSGLQRTVPWWILDGMHLLPGICTWVATMRVRKDLQSFMN